MLGFVVFFCVVCMLWMATLKCLDEKRRHNKQVAEMESNYRAILA